MQETQDQSLGQEDPLEKGMATHSSILAWSITWIEEPGGLQSLELQGVEQDWATNTFTMEGWTRAKGWVGAGRKRKKEEPGSDAIRNLSVCEDEKLEVVTGVFKYYSTHGWNPKNHIS